MKAYAILDGGGVKGAALAGCLKAADQRGVEFVGYGGTSAGAVVALLAAVGYTAQELEHVVVDEIEFTRFLDDDGVALGDLQRLGDSLGASRWNLLRAGYALLARRRLLAAVANKLGLYHAARLRRFLLEKVRQKVAALRNHDDITFDDLKRAGCRPLKVVASDVRLGKAVTYSGSGGADRNGSVIDAVRASMSYPFVFQPVKAGSTYLVDGGLSSNLPVHLFADETKLDGLPVIAFDLIPQPVALTDDYELKSFVADILSTAVEAGDRILRRTVNGVYHVEVRTDPEIKTLDFQVTRTQRRRLFENGYGAAQEFFSTRVPHWFDAGNRVEALQALYGDPNLVQYLLGVLADDVERVSTATGVRANIMLPTPQDTRIVAYHYGMDNDPDVDFELALDGGASGVAWSEREPVFVDLVEAAEQPDQWNMTPAQRNKVRKDRKAMLSVPIFRLPSLATSGDTVGSYEVLGTLSVDTDTPLADSGWELNSPAETCVRIWADVFGKLLTT